MIRVHCGSRLHFGLINPFSGLDVRQFGGVGLMICEPALTLSVEPSSGWSAEGPQAERALAYARQVAALAPREIVRPQRLALESTAREHVGLGLGTQLALAVSRALSAAWDRDAADACEIAAQLGRGRRSAIGIHGFQYGGFLIEAGKSEHDTVAPLAARRDFPEHWRVVLAIPEEIPGLHGQAELDAFARLAQSRPNLGLVDRLCRLALLGMLPAIQACDIEAFGEALFDFNRLAGEAFAPVQGGTYASPHVEALVGFFRSHGVRGVAQSSWGPTVAAIVADMTQAQEVVEAARKAAELPKAQFLVTSGHNEGATVEAPRTQAPRTK